MQIGATPWPVDDFARFVGENKSLVAIDDADRPLGFAVTGEVDGIAWLKELSVDPGFMRRGVGSALIEEVAKEALATGYRLLALSTFRDVPFNAPFYLRRGFEIVDTATAPAPLAAQVRREVPEGAKPGDRVLMIRKLYT